MTDEHPNDKDRANKAEREAAYYRQMVINLCASLTLADHMGDAYGDCEKALNDIGITIPQDDDYGDHWSFLMKFLAREHGAETVWGTSLADDDEEGDDDD